MDSFGIRYGYHEPVCNVHCTDYSVEEIIAYARREETVAELAKGNPEQLAVEWLKARRVERWQASLTAPEGSKTT